MFCSAGWGAIFSLLPRGPMWEQKSCMSFASCRFLIRSDFLSFNMYSKFDLDWPLSTFLRGFTLLLEPTHTLRVEVGIITELRRIWQNAKPLLLLLLLLIGIASLSL